MSIDDPTQDDEAPSEPEAPERTTGTTSRGALEYNQLADQSESGGGEMPVGTEGATPAP